MTQHFGSDWLALCQRLVESNGNSSPGPVAALRLPGESKQQEQAVPATSSRAELLGQGLFWQDLRVGQAFRTYTRTVTETDLVQFATLTGMVDSTFLDAAAASPMGGRPVPAALSYSIIEGFIIQSLIRGTGIAMLACAQEAIAPVRVNDTIHALVEITAVQPTSSGGRAIVDSTISIFNQLGKLVLRYTSRRMIAGRPLAEPPPGRA